MARHFDYAFTFGTSAGYTKGNVQVISLRANQIKSDATADEIMAVAKYCKEQEDDSI